MIMLMLWIFFAILCGILANNKGRSVAGWVVLGLFFGIFSAIIVAVLPSLKAADA